MKKCIVFSKEYKRLDILCKFLEKDDKTQLIFIDDINLLKDILKNSQNDSLYLILDFEYEDIRNIKDFAYDCISFKENIKCALLPAKRFNISHQKIGLVHFVRKGKVVSSFDELLATTHNFL